MIYGANSMTINIQLYLCCLISNDFRLMTVEEEPLLYKNVWLLLQKLINIQSNTLKKHIYLSVIQ
jgi:hypothetical protein